ncbi:hypothetical protein [Streptococcus pluranimalium]|uniref:hypothetical protein n=1 Tax=Streptococcus pluranimalium TaxID=82348 RepID=UPI003F68DF49
MHISSEFITQTTHGRDIIGQNIFNARSADDFFRGTVKSSGNNRAGDPFAKNLSGQGDLKAFNNWFNQMKVSPNTCIKIEWTIPTDILFTII